MTGTPYEQPQNRLIRSRLRSWGAHDDDNNAHQAPTEVDPVTGGSPQALRQQEADTIARLAALKPVEFDQVRKEEAKAMGIQVKTPG
jgi:hypothetical protein